MSQKIALLFALLFALSSLSGIASAQTIDPCWYGCPKSGCPQCPEGGPIKAMKGATATSRKECVQDCKKNNRDRVKDCKTHFPPKSEAAKHRECLDKAKTMFDACMAACK